MLLALEVSQSRRSAADPAANPARYHSLDFLINAYLKLGQDQQAKRIVDGRNSVTEYPANFRYSGHTAFAAIPVRYAFERAAWAEAAALAIPKTPFKAEAITWFGRAIGAARSGDRAKAKKAVEQLRMLKEGHPGAGCRGLVALAEGRKAAAIAGCAKPPTSKIAAGSMSRWKTASHRCGNCSSSCC